MLRKAYASGGGLQEAAEIEPAVVFPYAGDFGVPARRSVQRSQDAPGAVHLQDQPVPRRYRLQSRR
jgi:hypothetical protein